MKETAALKQNYARVNSSPFINKNILKAMKRNRLINDSLKHKCEANKKA